MTADKASKKIAYRHSGYPGGLKTETYQEILDTKPEEARAAMAALATGEVDPRPLITNTGSLSDLPGFLEAQARGEGVRYGVVPD